MSLEWTVAENASWCDLVWPGQFRPRAWTSATRTPEYYPDAVTLSPDATAADVLPFIDGSAGCSVKDSFATLDLPGFSVLFEATWLACGPGVPEPGWQRAASPLGPTVAVLTHGENEVVAHRGEGVVGLSNFSGSAAAWPGAVAAVASAFPGVPVVGYEHGDALRVALDHGAQPLGPLRILVR
ncbi:hypothetical protein [Amycolatopsis eburnea]|uniref:Uncharacterized protein n=1 Tax=Amycolatopsis eburnea TaxID=2267691 RepID=A0A427TGE5_9PSEU|nr:hypothetical protein [Amycolatopsis eburnea]RSD22124.1 hypothetical protein EIY87_09985 [Amycolatopsis eburnea]